MRHFIRNSTFIPHLVSNYSDGRRSSVDGQRRQIARGGGSMRIAAVLVGAIMLALAATAAQSAVRIVADPGGQIGPYLENLAALRSSGERVMRERPCLSARTMVLGVIPHECICVTPRARLGFHAAWNPGDNGRPVMSKAATQLLMDIYPERVRSWIKERGGLSPKMMYLSGRELAAMYHPCEEARSAAPSQRALPPSQSVPASNTSPPKAAT